MTVLRLSTANLLEGLAAADVSAPSTAPGYAAANLLQGGIDLPWQGSSAATQHDFWFRLPAGMQVDFAAAFDVQASAGTVTAVSLAYSTAWPVVSSTTIGALSMGERGDGSLSLDVPVSYAVVGLRITTSTAALLSVGGIWIGRKTDLSRMYATRQDTLDYAVIANVSESRGVRTAELSDYITRLSLGFDRLLNSERDEVLAAVKAVRGQRCHLVIVPNSDEPAAVYHGRLQAQHQWAVDYPVNTGLALQFTESGRALG